MALATQGKPVNAASPEMEKMMAEAAEAIMAGKIEKCYGVAKAGAMIARPPRRRAPVRRPKTPTRQPLSRCRRALANGSPAAASIRLELATLRRTVSDRTRR